VAGVATSFPFLRSLMDRAQAEVVLIDVEPMAIPAATHEWLLELLELIPAVLLSSAPDSAVFNRLLMQTPEPFCGESLVRTDHSRNQRRWPRDC